MAGALRWLAVFAFFVTGTGLLFIQFEQARYFQKQERLRSGSFVAAENSTRIHAAIGKAFGVIDAAARAATMAGKGIDRLEVSSLGRSISRGTSQSWEQLVPGEFVVVLQKDNDTSSARYKWWNLSRPIHSADGVLAWQDTPSQKVFFASMTSSGLVVLCLSPADVMVLLSQDKGTDQANVAEKNSESSATGPKTNDFESALLAYPDGRVLSHQGQENKASELLVTTDSVGLNLPFLQQSRLAGLGGLGGGVPSVPGARVLDSSGSGVIVASAYVPSSNLNIVSVSQVPLIPLLQTAFNLPALLMIGILMAFALLYAWSQRILAKDRLRVVESASELNLGNMQARLDSLWAALLRMSDWQIAATSGSGLVLSAPGSLGDFGLPGSAVAVGQSEINPNWQGRMFIARIGRSECFAIAIIDAVSPIREAMCIYMETLFGMVPQLGDAEIPNWIAQRRTSFEDLFAHFSANDADAIKALGVFFWSPVEGVLGRFGALDLQIVENEFWNYVQIAGPSGAPEVEFDARSPLILWRTLKTAQVVEQSVASAEAGESAEIVEPAERVADADPAEQVDPTDAVRDPAVSACHWGVVIGLGVAVALINHGLRYEDSTGLVQHAFASGSVPESGSQPKPESGPSGAQDKGGATQKAAIARGPIGFTVDSLTGLGRYRPPLQADFRSFSARAVLPMGSEIVLSKELNPTESLRLMFSKEGKAAASEPQIVMEHGVHGRFTLVGEGTFVLSEDFFARNLGGLRFSETEEIPSRIELKSSTSVTPLERIFAFFLPRNDIPTEFPVSARSEVQQRFPIVVRYPERVYLLKTNSLPAVISLSWQDAPEHTKPYRIYLWSEDRASNAPILESAQTTAAVQVSAFGRYYWQVEDRLGNFISAPRTLLIAALDAPVAGPGESDSLRPGKQSIFREIRNIPVAFPVADALIYGCPEKGDRELPVRFEHSADDVVSYELSVSPSRKKAGELAAPSGPVVVLSSVELPQEGSFSLKVLGYDKNKKVVATSEQLRGVFYTACGLGARPDFLAQVFKVTTGRSLPDLGMLHVMDGAY